MVVKMEKNIENHFPKGKVHCQEWKELPGKMWELHHWKSKQRLGRDVRKKVQILARVGRTGGRERRRH